MISDRPSEQVLPGRACTITATTTDQYGEPGAAVGTVTVTVTDSAGTAVTAGAVATSGNVHSATITAGNMPTGPDLLTAVWSDDSIVFTTNIVEVCGGHYCTIAELRAVTALADIDDHPPAELRDDRWAVETLIESNLGRGFVPRFATSIVQADGSDLLVLPKPDLRSVVWANYWTGTGWSAVSGTLSYVHENPLGWAVLRDSCWPAGPIQIGWRYGWDRPPQDMKDATIHAIANHRHGDQSGISSRVTQINQDGMNANLATAGTRRTRDTSWITADPKIDEVLNRPEYMWNPPVAG